MKKSQLKEIIRNEIRKVNEEDGIVTTGDTDKAEDLVKKGINVNLTEEGIDPYEVAKDLVGVEARNRVFKKWGIDKSDYDTSYEVMEEAKKILEGGW